MQGVEIVYTYNGDTFDLPFIKNSLGIDLVKHCRHHDLVLDCWRNNLYGGFKTVQNRLRIERLFKSVNGLEAIGLWWKYRNDQDEDALKTLLKYNEEDVVNLKALREKLSLISDSCI